MSHRGRGRGGRGARGGQYRGDRGRGYHGAIGRGRRPRDCLDYKLLGKCERNDAGECSFSHTNKERFVTFSCMYSYNITHSYCLYYHSNPPSETVMIPDKIPMTTAVIKTFIKLIRNISECRLKPASSNSVKIIICSVVL